MATRDWKPWLVVQVDWQIEHSPIVALVESKRLLGGNNFALEFFSPFSVIVRSLLLTYFARPISEGVNQFISPPQKEGMLVSGVPPLTTEATSEIVDSFHPALFSKMIWLSPLIRDSISVLDTLVEKMFYPSDGQLSLKFKENNQQWEQHFLKDVVINFSQRNKSQTQYPMCSVTNDLGFVPQSERFEERDMIGENISSYKIVNKGDFAYNPARINVGSIAKYEGDKPCMISSLYVCFRPKSEMSSEWLRHLLKSKRMIYNYNLFGEGGVRIYLFFPNFGRIKISVPPLEEQEKIATVISTIEQKISVENSILNKMNTQKSFLLTKMFI